jgi:hypothetical protein
MNPWHWNRVHQVAWIVSSAIGAVVGLMLAFTHSPLFSGSQTLHAFVVWLSFPELYWQWPVFSFLVTGITFYAMQRLKSSN